MLTGKVKRFITNLTSKAMTQQDPRTARGRADIVKSTKEGKLYITPTDLFSQSKVQGLIQRVVESKALEGVNKLTPKVG
jgi:hypothetical protein